MKRKRKVKAKTIDKRFDQGKDVLKYFDKSKARVLNGIKRTVEVKERRTIYHYAKAT